jgi:hypothetical protein
VLVRHREDAEDVLQETFMKLLRHLEAGGDTANLRGWLFTVAAAPRGIASAASRWIPGGRPTTPQCRHGARRRGRPHSTARRRSGGYRTAIGCSSRSARGACRIATSRRRPGSGGVGGAPARARADDGPGDPEGRQLI